MGIRKGNLSLLGRPDQDTLEETLTELTSLNEWEGSRACGKTTIKENASRNIMPDLPNCPVCLEDIAEGQEQFLPCGHSLHPKCANGWFQHSATCPICRKPVWSL